MLCGDLNGKEIQEYILKAQRTLKNYLKINTIKEKWSQEKTLLSTSKLKEQLITTNQRNVNKIKRLKTLTQRLNQEFGTVVR